MTRPRNLLFFAFGTAVALAACGRARQSEKLAYPGNPKATLGPIAAEITARGYKPTCKEDEYCHFNVADDVRVHFKVAGKTVVLAVDVLDAKDLPAKKVAELTENGEKIGHAIWDKARVAAEQQEKDAASAEAARKAEEARASAEAEKNKPQGGGVSLSDVADFMNKVKVQGGAGAGAGAPAQGGGSAEMSCCVNGAYYACPSAAAVNKCGGETAACLTKCMNSSDMKCGDRCLADHPPDPSGCSRDSSRDGTCHK